MTLLNVYHSVTGQQWYSDVVPNLYVGNYLPQVNKKKSNQLSKENVEV